jgi:hypothetical protein
MELTRRPATETGHPPLVEAHRALLMGQYALADGLAREGVARATTAEEQRWGRELQAWTRLLAGDVAGAHQLASTMPTTQPASQSFSGSLALVLGRRDEGVSVLTWAFVREPAGPAKSLAAIVAARTGAVDALVHELRAMGPEGAHAADLVTQLVAYAHQTAPTAPSPSSPPSPPSVPSPPTAASPPSLPPPPTHAWPSEPPSAPPTA